MFFFQAPLPFRLFPDGKIYDPPECWPKAHFDSRWPSFHLLQQLYSWFPFVCANLVNVIDVSVISPCTIYLINNIFHIPYFLIHSLCFLLFYINKMHQNDKPVLLCFWNRDACEGDIFHNPDKRNCSLLGCIHLSKPYRVQRIQPEHVKPHASELP